MIIAWVFPFPPTVSVSVSVFSFLFFQVPLLPTTYRSAVIYSPSPVHCNAHHLFRAFLLIPGACLLEETGLPALHSKDIELVGCTSTVSALNLRHFYASILENKVHIIYYTK